MKKNKSLGECLKNLKCPNCDKKLYTLKNEKGKTFYCKNCKFTYLKSNVVGGFSSIFEDPFWTKAGVIKNHA